MKWISAKSTCFTGGNKSKFPFLKFTDSPLCPDLNEMLEIEHLINSLNKCTSRHLFFFSKYITNYKWFQQFCIQTTIHLIFNL